MRSKLNLIASILSIFATNILCIIDFLMYRTLVSTSNSPKEFITLYLFACGVLIAILILSIISAIAYRKREEGLKKRVIISNVVLIFIILEILFLILVYNYNVINLLVFIVMGMCLIAANTLYLIVLLHENKQNPVNTRNQQ